MFLRVRRPIWVTKSELFGDLFPDRFLTTFSITFNVDFGSVLGSLWDPFRIKINQHFNRFLGSKKSPNGSKMESRNRSFSLENLKNRGPKTEIKKTQKMSKKRSPEPSQEGARPHENPPDTFEPVAKNVPLLLHFGIVLGAKVVPILPCCPFF